MKQYTYFPSQKVATKEKTPEWFKDCVNSAEKLILLQTNSEMDLQRKMKVWYDLYRDVINENEIMDVLNPMQFDPETFPANIKKLSFMFSKDRLDAGRRN